MPLIDRENHAVYLSVSEIADRWRISASVVREVHISRQGLEVQRVAGRMVVRMNTLLEYERKRINQLRGEIKRRQRQLRLLEHLQAQPSLAA